MGKFKPAGTRKKTAGPARGGLPCIILLVSGMALLLVLFYMVMKSS